MYIQIAVHNENNFLICWVEKNKKLKPGSKVKFKESKDWYIVDTIYKTEIKNPDVRNQINELKK
jgi:hypothetical protein